PRDWSSDVCSSDLLVRALIGHLLAAQHDPSRRPGLEPEQRPHQLAPSGADQPGDAEYFAATQLEAGLFQDGWRGDIVYREDHVAFMAFPLSGTARGPGGEGGAVDHVRD